MTKVELINSLTRGLNKTAFKVKQHSPEILAVGGVIGLIGSGVMACVATTRVNDILEEAKATIGAVREMREDVEAGNRTDYTLKECDRALTVSYAQAGLQLGKLYGPAVGLATLSTVAIFASTNILKKRVMTWSAAYTAVSTSFKEYRERVVERFGKDLDRELRYNIKTEKVEEIVTDENGKEKKVKKTIEVADPNTYSDYAKFFEPGCPAWTKNPELNLLFLKQTQNYANEKLQRQGHLFLNEVYDMLGIDRTALGAIAGWIYDPSNPDIDCYVDFDIYNVHKRDNQRFVNGYENVILLDFNVDGNIVDKI